MQVAGFFRIPRAADAVQRWHVGPVVDLSAYAFSWLWALVPLALLGEAHGDYVVPFLVVLAVTGVHRHFGLPYVYLDSQVRSRYRTRFVLFPLVMLAAWMASPWLVRQPITLSTLGLAAGAAWVLVLVQVLRRDGSEEAVRGKELAVGLGASLAVSLAAREAWIWLATALLASTYFDVRRTARTQRRVFATPLVVAALGALALGLAAPIDAQVGGFGIAPVADVVALAAGVWNVWHVYMQKYGILRMYSAKSGSDVKVSAYKDRLLVFAWLPLYFAWLGPRYRDVAMENFGSTAQPLAPLLDLLAAIEPVTVPIGVAIVVGAVSTWLRAEWQAHRLRNAPRLCMGLGTTALASTFFFMNPVKVYLAFAFSHAIEYMVFVWAFQRRRYQSKLPHDPTLGRILKRPLIAYAVFVALVGGAYLYFKYFGREIAPGAAEPQMFGYPTFEWAGYWAVYQSMVHFYFDGFLWKMRLPALRASL